MLLVLEAQVWSLVQELRYTCGTAKQANKQTKTHHKLSSNKDPTFTFISPVSFIVFGTACKITQKMF